MRVKNVLFALTTLISAGHPLATHGESIALHDDIPNDESAALNGTVAERLKGTTSFSLVAQVIGSKRDDHVQSEVASQLERNLRVSNIPLLDDPSDTSGDNPFIAVFIIFKTHGNFHQFHFSFNVRIPVDNPLGGPRLSAMLSRNVTLGVVSDPADLEEELNKFLTHSVKSFTAEWRNANMVNNFPLPE